MTNPNFGLLGGNNALQMFGVGAQMGQQIRQRQEEKEYKNALMQFDPSNPETLKPIMAARPEVGLQLQSQVHERQQEARLREVAMRAKNGDVAATDELFALKPDLWRTLDERSREAVKESTSYMAQTGLRLNGLPEEQRAAAWTAAVQQAEAGGMDIPAYLETYSPQALEAAMARASKMESYIKQFEPDYMAIPQGGTLVDTRNPAAVQQFGQAATIPPPPAGFVLDDGGPASAPGNFPR